MHHIPDHHKGYEILQPKKFVRDYGAILLIAFQILAKVVSVAPVVGTAGSALCEQSKNPTNVQQHLLTAQLISSCRYWLW